MADRLTEEEFVSRLSTALAREAELRSLVAHAKPRGGAPPAKVSLRVWGQAGDLRATLTHFEGKRQTRQETVAARELPSRARELVSGFAFWELSSSAGTLHARRAKKAILATEGRPDRVGSPVALPHDRKKALLLDPADPKTARLLRAIGLAGKSGHVLPGRERKLRQVEQFVRLVLDVIAGFPQGELRILDAGCGAAYLTFALRHVLAAERGSRVRVLGIDVRDDVIEKARAIARELEVEDDVTFRVGKIRDAVLDETPHVVLSLHACDTATDEALARGVALEARAILAAPCCQHELHKKLGAPPLAPLLRHGILRERLADLATDGLRALLLRASGWKTDVVEFIDPDATSKNVLIRAVKIAGAREPEGRWQEELAELKRALRLDGPVELEKLLGRA
jgi:SAM-dependent methyltransferase